MTLNVVDTYSTKINGKVRECQSRKPQPTNDKPRGRKKKNTHTHTKKNTKLRIKRNKQMHGKSIDQGPVVQSIVSLTKSLVNDSLSLLVRLKSSVLICFAERNVRSFCTAKAPHIFSTKNGSVFMYNMFEILTSR